MDMAMLKFTRDHEWVLIDGDTGVVGITDYAQRQLGDIVFVELPEIGRKVIKGEDTAVVESVKAASEIYSPVDGEVLEINRALNEEPALINSAPVSDGWFFKLGIHDATQLDELMDEADYKTFLEGLE
ncbi:glycine cleavage system H protein [uncultured Gammaproteobacteria bacterium]